MTGKKQKPGWVSMTAGIALVVIFCLLTPCSGMDAMTQSEMGDMCGRAGLTMAFGSTCTATKATFHALNWGDPDGWGATGGINHYAGWLVLIGSGSNTATLSVTIPAGAEMKVSAATTGACTFTPGSGPGLAIPPITSFFTFSLSDVDIGLQTPTTIWINLSPASGQRSSSESWKDSMGLMRATNLMIDKADKESTLYIWAH
jgi:hypothetical protein